MLVLSLFPGLGLLDLAFELEGFTVVRGPDVLWGGDIRTFHPPAGKFDGICGGPPCQSFSSLAHLVRANGHEPRFGNLIPEFERCVLEAQPAWFLMENVPAAPEPVVAGYGMTAFMLDNSFLDRGDGHGEEQRRVRKFCFGQRGVERPPSLMRWIDLATFILPDANGTITQWTPNNSQEAKGRKQCTNGDTATSDAPAATETHVRDSPTTPSLEGLSSSTATPADETGGSQKPRFRRQAVVRDPDATPVKIGGSGKVKSTYRTRHETVTGGNDRPPSQRQRTVTALGPDHLEKLAKTTEAVRAGSVTSSDGGASVRMRRYTIADACRLQGLPEDFLVDAPFTAAGKLKAVANGVPIPMGRAIARAIKEAIHWA